jgi:hypothetical protein
MAVRYREQSSATLSEDTEGAARVCGYQRQRPARACLSNHFDRITLFSIQFGEALHRGSKRRGCTVHPWSSRASSGPPIVSKFGAYLHARREVSALSKAYFPPSFQALQLKPRRGLLTTFGVASHVGTIGNPLLPGRTSDIPHSYTTATSARARSANSDWLWSSGKEPCHCQKYYFLPYLSGRVLTRDSH